MLHNKTDSASDVVTTVNDKTFCPAEMDHLNMLLSECERDCISETNEK